MTQLAPVLSNWIADPLEAAIRPVTSGGFSGAQVWQVEYRGRMFALRRWQAGFPESRLIGVHSIQGWLGHAGLPVPTLVRTSAAAQTIVREEDALWELATWMPGLADYHEHSLPEKLDAAMCLLARLHLTAAKLPTELPSWEKATRVSPALMRRSERLCNLVLADNRRIRNLSGYKPANAEQRLALKGFTLLARTAEAELQKSQRWETEELPLQWCLRDVRDEHVLFTENCVTGLVDFGAVGFDSPAGDVARLLGSLVGDDREGWRRGLEAYESIKPLSAVEREAIVFFDSSGVVISTANWLTWLFGPKKRASESWHRPAALKRLAWLVGRLEVAANR